MFGRYGAGHEVLPRVLHISVARYRPDLPQPGQPLEFLVSIHEEGTGITWQQNITVDSEAERYFLDTTQELYLWSLNKALTPRLAAERTRQLGKRLYGTFVGQEGEKYLAGIEPTAILLDVDETILNLPWELMATAEGVISQQTPFGRLVTTRVIPRPGRNPLQEDAVVRILAVGNPTGDLPGGEAELAALSRLQGAHSGCKVEVTTLVRGEATRARFVEMLVAGDHDILHFSGHGSLNPDQPETSSIYFADGPLSADSVLELPWKAPPYLVFNSACESGRAAGGKRLASAGNHHNGLAAAFLTAGVEGYVGYFWPVTEVGASLFSNAFYRGLFEYENVGVAFLRARSRSARELADVGDLTGYSAVLFGDAASKHRRDLAQLV